MELYGKKINFLGDSITDCNHYFDSEIITFDMKIARCFGD